jgi:hypothetical protein
MFIIKLRLQNQKHTSQTNPSITSLMSSVAPRIILPIRQPDHIWDDSILELYYDERGRLIIPPNFFDLHIDCIIDHLTKLDDDPHDSRRKILVLTEAGRRWTEEAFPSWPFFDRDQRDELHRPYRKFEKTEETKLAFAVFIQTFFGTSRRQKAMFGNHLHAALREEIVRRCTEDGGLLPDGTRPKSIKDVLNIITSDHMKELYKTDKSVPSNKMVRWVKGITFEDSISWVESSIEDWFDKNGMLVVLGSGLSTKTRRNSLVRIAVKKGTTTVKDRLKVVEEKAFGWTLVLDQQVHRYAKQGSKENATYIKRMTDPNYDIVLLDPSLVPTSRKKYPAFWVKRRVIDASMDVEAMVVGTVNAAVSEGWSLQQLVNVVETKYELAFTPENSPIQAEDIPIHAPRHTEVSIPVSPTEDLTAAITNADCGLSLQAKMSNIFVRAHLY